MNKAVVRFRLVHDRSAEVLNAVNVRHKDVSIFEDSVLYAVRSKNIGIANPIPVKTIA